MTDRIRGRPRTAAKVAERSLEEIRRDGAFDHDPDFEHIIKHDTNGFTENDSSTYEQQQLLKSRKPPNSVYHRGGLE